MSICPIKCNIIIPSSKLVTVEMQNEFGAIPPILVPILGKIALNKIIESYNHNCDQFFVGIQEGSDFIQSYFNFFTDSKVKLVKISNSESISDTIEKTISNEPDILKNSIVLNFADTIVRDLNPELLGKDFIIFAKTKETERWTLFRENGGKITHISDKKYLLDESTWKTFLGVWGFSDPTRFFKIIQAENHIDKSKAFYNAVLKYAEEHPMAMQESKDWIDVGHVDNYFAARKNEINTRFFNKIQVKDVTGTLTKTSADRVKLRNEINWYISIPKELKYYIPTIFDFSLEYSKPSVEMEFYSYPSLDDYFVYAKVDFDAWENIFAKIFSIIAVASKYTVREDDIKSDLEQMYYYKTLQRLEQFSKENPKLYDMSVDFKANDKNLISLKEVIKSLRNFIIEFGLYDTEELQIIHGDLCFSNILYDNKHGIIKLVDPRGQFGKYSLYGDVYYDLAKVSHSVLGFYDLIMFDQFKIKSDKDMQILWWNPTYQIATGKIFTKHLKKAGFDIAKTRFIEALLFLSMLPLHRDHPQRQQAMLIRGLSLITELVQGENRKRAELIN